MASIADLEAMRYHARVNAEYIPFFLARLSAAMKAERQPKPKRDKPITSRKGSWAETANSVPQHIKDHYAATHDLFYHAVTLGPYKPH